MTVITFRKSDLEKLVGVKLPEEKLVELLNRVKGEVESIEQDEVKMEVTHDRPDMFSVEGIARTLKGLLEIETGMPKIDISIGDYTMIVENVEKRPYIVTCIVRDVELDDEAIRQIMQLQEKLHQTYGRDRRLFAIGFYDADLIKFPIKYRKLKVTEVYYKPLGYTIKMRGDEVLQNTEKGRLYAHLALHDDGTVPVIQDSEDNILVLIPVLNSEDYKVTERTRNVMIDVTGPSLKHVLDVMKILIYNLVERSRSKRIILPRIVNVAYEDQVRKMLVPAEYELTLEDISDLAGIDLSITDTVRYLMMSRYDVEMLSDNKLKVYVPPYRINVLHKVDIIEDVLIAYGYNNIPRELPLQDSVGKLLYITRFSNQIRAILRGLGFKELSNYIMTAKKLLELTGQARGVLEVVNPRSELYNCVRTCIWPQLVETIKLNEELAHRGLKVFDIGEIAYYTEDGKIMCEKHVALAITGRELTITDMLIVLKTFFLELGLKPKYEKTRVEGLVPERTAKVIVKDVEVGIVGEVHPEVLTKLELYYPVVVCELNLDKLAMLVSG